MKKGLFFRRFAQEVAAVLIAGTAIVSLAEPSFTYSGSGTLELVLVNPAGDVSISIPSASGNAPVRSIAAGAFAGCGNVTDIHVPTSIEMIEAGAFDDCASLTGIWVDDGNPVFSDSDGALCNFSGEVLVTCPAGRSGTFTIPIGVKSVADGAFANCQLLTKIVIPTSVTDIGAGAFSDCIGLGSIVIPQNCQYDVATLSIPESCTVSRYEPNGIEDPSLPPRWAVVYNPNGGTGTMAEHVFYVGVAANLHANAFTRTGYTFAGWALSASGAAVFTNWQTVQDLASAGKRITLFVKWTPNQYTVRFIPNGGTGSMANVDCTWGVSRALPGIGFSRTGYTFAGWARSANGAVEFKDRQSIKNLCASRKGVVNLYAKWTGIPYTAVFHEHPGGRTVSQALRYGTKTKLRKNTFTKKGYVFMGWSLGPDGSISYKDEQEVSGVTSNGGRVHFYAHWAVRNYAVRFKANGGRGNMANQSFVYDKPAILRSNAFTWDHHVFLGWALTPDGPVKYTNKQTITKMTASGKTITLYARWRPIRYSVVFDPNGGSGSMANQTFSYGSSAKLRAVTFKAPSDTARVFAGWSKNRTGKIDFGNSATVRNLANTDGALIRLYARWAIRDYKVRFNANHGAGTMADEAFVYGSAKELRANAFSRQNYLFLGWSRSATATKAEFSNKQSVRNLTMDGGVVTLYAVWQKIGDPNIVLCLGDSITEGYRCIGLPYPSRLAALSGKTVRNYGRGGECSDYGADIAEEALIRENPGYVCILFGANDAIHHRNPSGTKENLRQIIRLCKKYNAIPIIASPTPQIGSHARFDPEVRDIARHVRSLAQEEGVRFVDLYSIFDDPKKYLNPADGLHLSDAGGSLMARSFYREF